MAGILNLGDITFGITADYTGLEAARARVESFGNQVVATNTRATAALKLSTEQLNTMFMAQERNLARAIQRNAEFQAAVSRAGVLGFEGQADLADQANAALNDYIMTMTKLPAGSLEAQRANIALDGTFAELKRQLIELSAIEQEQIATSEAMAAMQLKVSNALATSERSMLAFQGRTTRTKGLGGQDENDFLLGAQASFDKYKASISKAELTQVEFAAATNTFRAEMQGHSLALQQWVSNFKNIPAAAQEAANGMQDLNKAAAIVYGPLNRVGSSVSALESSFRSANLSRVAFFGGLLIGGVALYELGKHAVETQIALQNVNAQLTVITGTSEAAAEELTHLHEVANITGTNFLDIAKSFGTFQIAGREAGIGAEKLQKAFDQVVSSASSLHRTPEQLNEILEVFERMLSRGVVTSQMLRGLATEIPGAAEVMGKAFGFVDDAAGSAEKKMNDFMKTGNVFAADAVPKLAQGLYDLTVAMKGVSAFEGMQQDINRLHNAMYDLFNTFNESLGASEAFDRSLKGMISFIGVLEAGLRNLDEVLTVSAALLMGLFFPEMVNIISGIVAAVGDLTVALWSMDAAALASGWIPLLGRLAAGLAIAALVFTTFKTSAQQADEQMDKNIKNIDDYIAATLRAKVYNAAASSDALERNERLIKLEEQKIAVQKRAVEAAREQESAAASAASAASDGVSAGIMLGQTLETTWQDASKDLDTYSDKLDKLNKQHLHLEALLELGRMHDADAAKDKAERLQEVEDKINQQIKDANSLAGAHTAGELALREHQKSIADAVRSASDELKRAGELVSDLPGKLKGALNAEDLAKGYIQAGDAIRHTKQALEEAQAEAEHPGMGTYLKKIHEIDEATKKIADDIYGQTQSMQLATSVAGALGTAMKLAFSTEGTREKNKISDMISGNEELAASFQLSKQAGAAFQEQMGKTAQYREMEIRLISMTGDADKAHAMIEALKKSFQDVETAKAGAEIGDFNEKIKNMSTELEAAGHGDFALKEATKAVELANKVKEASDQLYAAFVHKGEGPEQAKADADTLAKSYVTLGEQLQVAQDQTKEYAKVWDDVGGALGTEWDQLFEHGAKGIKDFGQVFEQAILKMIADLIKLQFVMPILNSLGGQASQGLSSFGLNVPGLAGIGGSASSAASAAATSAGSTTSSAFAAGGILSFLSFAGGGDPPMGQYSMVGENGPELFRPNTSGTIIPLDKLGGGDTYHLSMPAYVSLAGANGTETIVAVAQAAVRAGQVESAKQLEKNFPKMMAKAQRKKL